MTTDNRMLRNIALIAHGGGGKTTLAETLLFNAKSITKRGAVERGTTVMSTEPEEVARHITTTPHVAHFTWRDCAVNLVDTPGYIDFLEATRGVLSVVGGAVLIFSGESGIKPETERLASMIRDALVPALGFINEMDKPRANFIRTLGEIETSLNIATLPLTIPIGSGETFMGIVDLIPMTAWSAREGVFTQIDLPASARADAEHYRQQLVEKIVEADDQLLEKFLEDNQSPPDDVLHQGLKEALLTRRLLPVFCGSALANIGVRALANGFLYYLPNPQDKAIIKPIVGKNPEHNNQEETRKPIATDPFSAVVFKTTIDPYSGKLSVLRVFSGILEAEKEIYNSTRQHKEKGGRLFKLMGKEMQPVDRLSAGDMGAIAKLAHTQTGDTLCAMDHPINYERVKYIDPPLAFAVEVDTKTEDKVSTGLGRLVEEDPTLHFYRDQETHEMILAGMGQTHLAVALDRLKRKFGAVATLKTPRVPYRETITRKVRVQGRLKKQTGGRGQFGDCWIEMEPLPRDAGFVFEDAIVGGVIPRQFIPSVEKGIRESLSAGTAGGYPVVDFKVRLVDGSHHSVDSSDNAFRIAGAMAFKKGMEEGGAVILEPVMKMDVTVPDEVVGDVIGDLNSRRGRITGVVSRSGAQVIHADVPMAEVLDYGNVLNAITSGRGLYTMRIGTYQEVPSHIARKVLEGKKAG
ncbi:MAG: elongation factor G [Magnetococcales bacterium]|nr:elongation factor G [Magnetococcales bacterium]